MSVQKEFAHGDATLRVTIDDKGGERFVVRVGDEVVDVRARRTCDGRIAFRIGDVHHIATVAPSGTAGATHVRLDGTTWVLLPHEARRRTGAAGDGSVVEAPMTGTLLAIHVVAGDAVERGQVVAVLTAMKMEHKLLAHAAGIVTEIAVAVGATVEQGTLVVRIAPSTDGA